MIHRRKNSLQMRLKSWKVAIWNGKQSRTATNFIIKGFLAEIRESDMFIDEKKNIVPNLLISPTKSSAEKDTMWDNKLTSLMEIKSMVERQYGAWKLRIFEKKCKHIQKKYLLMNSGTISHKEKPRSSGQRFDRASRYWKKRTSHKQTR